MSNKILRHTFIFSFFVLLAQIIGLVRDIYLLRFFGAGATLDTYYLAFKIPDFLNLFYSVLLGSVILIPLLTKVHHNEGELGVQREINLVGSFVMTLVILATALLWIAMPYLASILVPNWSGSQQLFLVEISRILLLAQLFFPIGIMFGSVGMIYEKPLPFASAGAVYNVFILIGAIFLAPVYGVYGVVYGVISGAIAFSLVQVCSRESRRYFLGFRLKYNVSYYFEFIRKNIWRFITIFLNQFFAVMVATLAALGGAGQLTLFNNAWNIYMAIFYVLGASFATAIMPFVSRLHVGGETASVKNSLTSSVVNVFSLSMYFSIFIFFFAPEIIKVLYFFSNLSILEESIMIHVLQILSFSIATLNVIDVVRKYMYTIDMAYESIYVMIIFVPLTYILFVVLNNSFLAGITANATIYSLAIALSVANMFTTIAILFLMHSKEKIHGQEVLVSMFKSFFIACLVFVTSFFLQTNSIVVFGSSDFYTNFFIKLVSVLVLSSLFISFFRDRVVINIVSSIFKRQH
jgi:putative peptidoglycan lipid II flippase